MTHEILKEETITFKVRTIQKDGQVGYAVITEQNPYLAIGRLTKMEAIITAFTRYLERLHEIENTPKE